jgi:hypothetical protein
MFPPWAPFFMDPRSRDALASRRAKPGSGREALRKT